MNALGKVDHMRVPTDIQTDRAVNRNSEELRAIMCNGSCLVIYEKTSLWAVVAWKMLEALRNTFEVIITGEILR